MVFPWLLRKGIFISGVLKEKMAPESFFCRIILVTSYFFLVLNQDSIRQKIISYQSNSEARVSSIFSGQLKYSVSREKNGSYFLSFWYSCYNIYYKIKAIFLKNWTSKTLFSTQKMLALPKTYLEIDIEQNPCVFLDFSLFPYISILWEKMRFLGKFLLLFMMLSVWVASKHQCPKI